MRGCHWEVIDNNLSLTYDKSQWRSFFTKIEKAFQQVKKSTKKYTSNPGSPGKRQQDVLDRHAQVWLVKSPDQIPPKQVQNWQTEGDKTKVRGNALDFFYSDQRFKGVGNGSGNGNGKSNGNENVGGKLGTPSYVWIKSVFPLQTQPYQVVTIFGSKHKERSIYAEELNKLSKQNKAILVFGSQNNK